MKTVGMRWLKEEEEENKIREKKYLQCGKSVECYLWALGHCPPTQYPSRYHKNRDKGNFPRMKKE